MILSKLTSRSYPNVGKIRSFLIRQASGKGDEHHANPLLWQRLFYFVCCPAILLSMINTYLAEKEHWDHYKRAPFAPMEYLRIRTHKFPWGDGNHSLFHNPLVNPLPDGWEPLPPELAAKYDPSDIILSPTALAKLEKAKAAKGQ